MGIMCLNAGQARGPIAVRFRSLRLLLETNYLKLHWMLEWEKAGTGVLLS